MRHPRIILACVTVAALAGCKGDRTGHPTTAVTPPLAYVRYFNAVPDTLPLDFRPIDQLEFSQPFLAVPFRAIGLGNYQGYQAGSRKIRVFPNSTDLATTSSILVDTTVSLTAGTYYSFLHVGYARAGQAPKQGIVILTDALPDPGTGIAIRVVNVDAVEGNVDVYATAAATDPLPTSPTFGNIAFKGVSAYVTRVPGPLVLHVFAAGTTSPELITKTVSAGSAATVTGTTPVGGSTIAGSVITAIVYSKAVAGSSAAVPTGSSANTTPTIVSWIDKTSTATLP
jgi:hypothetical protein